MGKLQIIGRLARVAASAVTPMALDETKIINNQLGKHYIKIPDVTSLPLNRQVLEYEFNYALVKLPADINMPTMIQHITYCQKVAQC